MKNSTNNQANGAIY